MTAAAGLSGEEAMIARFFRPLARAAGAHDLADDAASFTPPEGCDLVLTKDALVAGVHFFADDPADAVAQKALRVNLSDLAAKGADPAGFLLAIALPDGLGPDWLEAFARGLGADADAYGCPLHGGDTVRTPGPLMVSVTAFGTLPRDSMVHRSGARPGDVVLVTGTIGDAALGLVARNDPARAAGWGLSADERAHLATRYLLPQPRHALAAVLRMLGSAAMDVSDGLAGDLAKLCRASGVSAEVDVAAVPLSAAVRRATTADPGLMTVALTGGDDYEILCTVADGDVPAFTAAARAAGVAVSVIGRITTGDASPRFCGAGGAVMELGQGSFSHF